MRRKTNKKQSKQSGPKNGDEDQTQQKLSKLQIVEGEGLPKLAALNGNELYDFYVKDIDIKLVENISPISKALTLSDASIKKKMKEDEILLQSDILRERLRRGNTIIVDKDAGTSYIARRGLPKFFDLRPFHLDVLAGRKSVTEFNQRSEDLALEYRTIIPRTAIAIKEEKIINIYLSEKANGENAQISSIEVNGIHYWVASSKNVGMIFNCESDIEKYQDERFKYAKLISKCWLSQIEQLDDVSTTSLKNYLKEHTFVGEYCGNQMLQHLVRYSKEEIRFYAVVPKYSTLMCLPISMARKIILGFSLHFVKMQEYLGLKTFVAIGNTLDKLDKKVNSMTVEEMGEGSVVYLESEDPNSGDKVITGICKLKTLEYRFWRKLREKLKSLINRKMNTEKLLSKFKAECLELKNQGDYGTVHPIEHYCDIASEACRLIPICGIDGDKIQSLYVDFLELVIRCHSENRDPSYEEIDYFEKIKLDPTKQDTIGIQFCKQEPLKGINILFMIPPGFVPFKELEEICSAHNIKLRVGWKQKSIEEDRLRVCLPSGCSITSKRRKKYTFIITLDTSDSTLMEAIADSVVFRCLTSIQIENAHEKKFLNECFNGDLTQKTIKQKIMYEVAKMGRLRKEQGHIIIEDCWKRIVHSDEPDEIKFNFLALEEKIVGLLEGFKLMKEQESLDIGNQQKMEIKETEEVKATHRSSNSITFIVFYATTAVGKSHWVNCLQQKIVNESLPISFHVVSSDECSKLLVEEYMSVPANQGKTEKEAFDAIKNKSRTLFMSRIAQYVESCIEGHHVVVLDKVLNSPLDLKKIQAESAMEDWVIQMLAIYPENNGNCFQFPGGSVPFSSSLLWNLFNRSLHRGEHLTLNGDDSHILFICMSFVLLYKNMRSIAGAKKRDADFTALIPIKFHHEIPKSAAPQDLIEAIQEALANVKPFNSGQEFCEGLAAILRDESRKDEMDEIMSYPTKEELNEGMDTVLSYII